MRATMRTLPGGHAYAEVASMHRTPSERERLTKARRSVLWGLVLPGVSIGPIPFTRGLSLGLLLLYPLNVARIAMRLRRAGEPRPWTVAAFLMLAKVPEAVGWLRYQADRFTGRRSKLIEYKRKTAVNSDEARS